MKHFIFALLSLTLFSNVVSADLLDNNKQKRDLTGGNGLNGPPLGIKAVDNIAQILKDSLAYVENEYVLPNYIRSFYMIGQLMSPDGQWLDPELENISEKLVPSTITVDEAKEFIDRVADIAKDNKYLLRMLKRASRKRYPVLESKRNDEVLPYHVIAWAMFLENLTRCAVDDGSVLVILKTRFEGFRDAVGLLTGGVPLSFFEVLKTISVDEGVRELILHQEQGFVDKDYGKTLLPMNIAEAVSSDIGANRASNAKAGFVLQINKPGEQPAKFSDDGKVSLVFVPKPVLWNDLYTVWNTAFVTGEFGDWPKTLVKLFIPYVNDHRQEPEAYLHKRLVSLYILINVMTIELLLNEGVDAMDWSDPELASVFGKANFMSAQEYANEIGWNFYDC